MCSTEPFEFRWWSEYIFLAHLIIIVHYRDVMMGVIASQITSLTIVHSTVYSDVDQRKHQSSASLAFVWGIHRGPVNSLHKWPVKRKMFPFDDVIMQIGRYNTFLLCHVSAVVCLRKLYLYILSFTSCRSWKNWGVCLFAHNTIPSSSLYRFIWKYWTKTWESITKYLVSLLCRVCVKEYVNFLNYLLCNVFGSVFSAYLFLFWWKYMCIILISLSNQKYRSLATV